MTGLRVDEFCTLKRSDEKGIHYIHIKKAKLYVDKKLIYEVKRFSKTKAGICTVVVPKDFRWIFKKLRKIKPFGEFVFMRKEKGRKKYASILLNHGVDESLAISQLEHSDIMCTENFYHKDMRSDSEKASIIDEIDEFQVAK